MYIGLYKTPKKLLSCLVLLVVKNKCVTLSWELSSFFLMQILRKNYCFVNKYGRLVTWFQTENSLQLK